MDVSLGRLNNATPARAAAHNPLAVVFHPYRFDSFSKVLSAGIRVGFCTAAAPVADRLELHTQSTSLHPCGVAQAIVRLI